TRCGGPLGPAYRVNLARPTSARPVLEPVHELNTLERLGDRCALVVYQSRVEADPLDDVEVEVGREPGCLLRPGDPKPAGGLEPSGELLEPGSEVALPRHEQHDDVHGRAGAPETLDAGRQGTQGRVEALGRAGEEHAGALADPELL